MIKGILSTLIWIIGLLVITYFYYQMNLSYQELEEATTLYPISTSAMAVFFISEVVGVALGIMSFRTDNKKIGLFGMGICTLNLILLFAQY